MIYVSWKELYPIIVEKREHRDSQRSLILHIITGEFLIGFNVSILCNYAGKILKYPFFVLLGYFVVHLELDYIDLLCLIQMLEKTLSINL